MVCVSVVWEDGVWGCECGEVCVCVCSVGR